MPELPEAETIVRSLRPLLVGQRIVMAEFLSRRVSRDEPARLAGRVVADVRRYGKQVVIDFGGLFALVKLGMTGALLWNAEPGPYTRAVLESGGGRLCFDDIRQFGSIALLDEPPSSLGPDPLEIGPAEFAQRLRARDTAVKRLLLDQSFIRGIGNIYADEALFRAGLHPEARTRKLTAARIEGLRAGIRELLTEAIEHRGSSISDYVDAAGERGGFQKLHRVYARDGQPCVSCGTAVERTVVAQRGTHFCPRCQKR